jgi:hypothetical protein
MKRLLIVFVSIITILAFFSLALAIDRTPKENKIKEVEEPVENPTEGGAASKEYEKTEVKEGKAGGITAPEKESEKIGEKKAKETIPEKVTNRLKSLEKQKTEEKYDYFIDKNNNGIDDRLERKSKEPVSPPSIRPIPKDEKPKEVTPSIKKTSEKKKTGETPKETKKVTETEKKKRR